MDGEPVQPDETNIVDGHGLDEKWAKRNWLGAEPTLIKAVLEWAYRQEKIDRLPRALDDYAKIALPKPTAQFYTTEEVKTLFDAALPKDFR